MGARLLTGEINQQLPPTKTFYKIAFSCFPPPLYLPSVFWVLLVFLYKERQEIVVRFTYSKIIPYA